MKRINLIVSCCLFVSCFSFAQEFPGYGIVNSAEINLKQCDFDKDANAVVLLHEAFSNYDDYHHLVTVHHIRVKILKEKGISAANVSIPFYRKDDFEHIDQVEGMTINATSASKIVNIKLEKKSIFFQKTNDRFGEVIFTFPGISPGSIIDYKYRSTMTHYGGLQDWDFQEELPVLMSKYTLIIVPNMEFAYRINKTLDIPIVIKKESSAGSVYFEMQNIPGLGDEPYMDARKDYLQQIIFQLSGLDRYGNGKSNYMTSWDELGRELLTSPEFGGQLTKNISDADDFIKQVKSLPSPEEKMKAVFNYVRSNMSWNRFNSKYSMDGVKTAWQRKSGSSGDINLLLINLLKEASLEAYPMLVSERWHGKVKSAYPFIDQFNSVIACVIIDKKKYYLDAADKSIPAHLTPINILNTTAFIVNRKAGGLITISDDATKYQEDVLVSLDLAENGTLSGDVSVKSKDYARIKKLDDYHENKDDKNKFIKRHFIVDGTSITGKDLEILNIENDSLPLEQHCKITGQLNTTGEYSFLPLNLFTGFDYNPFLSDNRFSNINFGYRRNINLSVFIQLPAGYIIDDLPKSVKLTDPDKDITYVRQLEYDKQDNSVRCMMSFEFKNSLYETDMYPVLKEVYQRIFNYLKEPIVLKKK
ncbi:MAG: DUF3857 domain-containing protein [Ferruginibacter sp.]